MNTVLVILGVIGFGAIVIAAYVFTVAARHYVSDDHPEMHPATTRPFGKMLARRSLNDRRKGGKVKFPLAINGTLIASDRRQLRERRLEGA